MKPKQNPSGNCQYCGVRTGYHLAYSGWDAGWWCDAHRPDRDGKKIQVRELLEKFTRNDLTREPDQEAFKYVFPQTFQDPRHPFHKEAMAMVGDKTAVIAVGVTTATLVPRDHVPRKMNRTERRAQLRRIK